MTPASLSRRTWAAFLDGMLLIFWVVIVALTVRWPEVLPGAVRAAIWFGPLFLGEPLEIRIFGQTIGQRLLGLRVVSRSGARLGLPRLLARHFSKVLFLGTSLLYTLFSPRGQALHDHLFGTDVVSLGGPVARVGPSLRHPLRAFLVSVAWGWLAGAFAAVLAALLLGLALGAIGREVPKGIEAEAVLNALLGMVFLAAYFRVLDRGASGRLRGTGGTRSALPES